MKKIIPFFAFLMFISSSFATDLQGFCSQERIEKLDLTSECQDKVCNCWYGTDQNDTFELKVDDFIVHELGFPQIASASIMLNGNKIGQYNYAAINMFIAKGGDDIIDSTPLVLTEWMDLPNGWFPGDEKIKKVYSGPMDTGSETYFFDGGGCDKIYGNPHRDHFFKETRDEIECDTYYKVNYAVSSSRASDEDKENHPNSYQAFNKDVYVADYKQFRPF